MKVVGVIPSPELLVFSSACAEVAQKFHCDTVTLSGKYFFRFGFGGKAANMIRVS